MLMNTSPSSTGWSSGWPSSSSSGWNAWPSKVSYGWPSKVSTGWPSSGWSSGGGWPSSGWSSGGWNNGKEMLILNEYSVIEQLSTGPC